MEVYSRISGLKARAIELHVIHRLTMIAFRVPYLRRGVMKAIVSEIGSGSKHDLRVWDGHVEALSGDEGTTGIRCMHHEVDL